MEKRVCFHAKHRESEAVNERWTEPVMMRESKWVVLWLHVRKWVCLHPEKRLALKPCCSVVQPLQHLPGAICRATSLPHTCSPSSSLLRFQLRGYRVKRIRPLLTHMRRALEKKKKTKKMMEAILFSPSPHTRRQTQTPAGSSSKRCWKRLPSPALNLLCRWHSTPHLPTHTHTYKPHTHSFCFDYSHSLPLPLFVWRFLMLTTANRFLAVYAESKQAVQISETNNELLLFQNREKNTHMHTFFPAAQSLIEATALWCNYKALLLSVTYRRLDAVQVCCMVNKGCWLSRSWSLRAFLHQLGLHHTLSFCLCDHLLCLDLVLDSSI